MQMKAPMMWQTKCCNPNLEYDAFSFLSDDDSYFWKPVLDLQNEGFPSNSYIIHSVGGMLKVMNETAIIYFWLRFTTPWISEL